MRCAVAAAAGLAILWAPVYADETEAPAPQPEAVVMRPLWEFGIGVAALRLPDYRGSDQSSALWLPLPYGVYRGKWLRADREGARAVLFDARSVEVDLSQIGRASCRERVSPRV